MSATNTLADILKAVTTATSLSGLSTLCVNASGMLAKAAVTAFLTAEMVATVEDIKAPGVFRLKQQPNLPNGASMEYSAVLSLKAGADMYLLALTHKGSAAYGFLDNGKDFKGWNMLTS